MVQEATSTRLYVIVRGAVQGVGYRPFVYRLAHKLGLTGWVNNSTQGVFIEVEGPSTTLEQFLRRLSDEKPPAARIASMDHEWREPIGYEAFEIHKSDASGAKTAFVLPELAACQDCLDEVLDPEDRRYRYPFTNCTNCGPRFSIIEALPYDRPNTTMKAFNMCEQCQTEYEDPLDRRFHAQPNACPDCGPHLELWDADGNLQTSHDDALLATVEALRSGEIVAVKGLGGFHLMVDARNQMSVRELRSRKHRPAKPLACMAPSRDAVRELCDVSAEEAELLTSPEAPIVLLDKRSDIEIAPSVSPENPTLGVMLPYTPLHHLLLREFDGPLVATSGNRSDEPICTDEQEALERLGEIADRFLVHNRPIARHVDDSVVRVVDGEMMMLRRARGYAPLPIQLPHEVPPTLAVGAHVKNTVAIAIGNQAFVSQHIGDLETEEAYEAFKRVVDDFRTLYDFEPERVVCDKHPDYLTTQYAESLGLPVTHVQHHVAHGLACMAEHHLEPPVLGVAWDGTGYGDDGTIWGGEFLKITDDGYERVAHLRTFPLPGGNQAIKEPRRSALGLLYERFGDDAFEMDHLAPIRSFTSSERKVLRQSLKKGINAPRTSSVGRLFDAVASLCDLRQTVDFEGEAAMALEFATEAGEQASSEMLLKGSGDGAAPIVIDWEPFVEHAIGRLDDGAPPGEISGQLHRSLSRAVSDVAQRMNVSSVALTGGCFQNRALLEMVRQCLGESGAMVSAHGTTPPNDGGIAIGQLLTTE